MSKRTFRIGTVGAGYFAQFHINAWSILDQADLVGICDLDTNKATALNKNCSAKIYQDVVLMLREQQLDILDIITPPETHRDLILLAMKYDVHIICQKPVTPTLQETLQLMEATKEYQKEVIIHENFRWMPWYTKISNLVKQGVIGQPHYLYHRMRMGDGWQADAYMNRQPYFRTMPRLLIHETGIHFIDVFRSIMGDVSEVYAKTNRHNKNIAGEDQCIVHFEFDNGASAILDASRYNESSYENPRYTFGEMLIEGNKGTIQLSENGKINIKLLGTKKYQEAYEHNDIEFGGNCVFFRNNT